MRVEEVDQTLQSRDPARGRLARALQRGLEGGERGRVEGLALDECQEVGEKRQVGGRLGRAAHRPQDLRAETERERRLHGAGDQHRPGSDPPEVPRAERRAREHGEHAAASARSPALTCQGVSSAHAVSAAGSTALAEILAEQRHGLAEVEARPQLVDRLLPAQHLGRPRPARAASARASPPPPGSARCRAARRASRGRRDRGRRHTDAPDRESARRRRPCPRTRDRGGRARPRRSGPRARRGARPAGSAGAPRPTRRTRAPAPRPTSAARARKSKARKRSTSAAANVSMRARVRRSARARERREHRAPRTQALLVLGSRRHGRPPSASGRASARVRAPRPRASGR